MAMAMAMAAKRICIFIFQCSGFRIPTIRGMIFLSGYNHWNFNHIFWLFFFLLCFSLFLWSFKVMHLGQCDALSEKCFCAKSLSPCKSLDALARAAKTQRETETQSAAARHKHTCALKKNTSTWMDIEMKRAWELWPFASEILHRIVKENIFFQRQTIGPENQGLRGFFLLQCE